jgi:hypothetical protein
MAQNRPDYDKYIAALALLGLKPGASIEDVRKAHRNKLRDCHPDHFPGDKEKEAEAQAVNAARDLLEQMTKDGSALTFAMMAERDRRVGDDDQIPLDGPIILIVNLVIAPAGVGKTRGLVRSVARRGARRPALVPYGADPLHIIIASPTIDLTEQTASELAANDVSKPVKVLHSKNSDKVGKALLEFYSNVLGIDEAVLLCTHQAIFDTPLPPDPAGWDIVFDEMPDTVKFLEIDAPDTHRFVSEYVTPEPLGEGVYHLRPHGDEATMKRLNRVATNRPFDGGLEHLKEIARALVNGHVVLVQVAQWEEMRNLWTLRANHLQPVYNGHIDVMVLVPPVWFSKYRSVTMLGARCLSHFTALVWSKVWRVVFYAKDLYGLPSKHTDRQSQRLVIWWLFEERATRKFLARKVKDRHCNLFMAACESVAAFYGDEPFLWSAPLTGPNGDKQYGVGNDFWAHHDKGKRSPKAFDTLLRLPGRTHGLNRPTFLDTCNVALLSVVNLTPEQYKLLNHLDLTEDEIDGAMAFDVAYQDMARCNIRLMDSDQGCHVTVLDERIARELADKFPGCHVQRYPPYLVPEGLRRQGKRGPTPSGKAQTSAQRQRAYRTRQAAQRDKQAAINRET